MRLRRGDCDATRSRVMLLAAGHLTNFHGRLRPVKITYAELSSIGPVRSNNEDFLQFWEAEGEQATKTHGAISLMADGVGGHGGGELASRLAVETSLGIFREADPTTTDNQLLWKMFNAANLAVYDAGMGREASIAWRRRSRCRCSAATKSPSGTSAIPGPTWCGRGTSVSSRQITRMSRCSSR